MKDTASCIPLRRGPAEWCVLHPMVLDIRTTVLAIPFQVVAPPSKAGITLQFGADPLRQIMRRSLDI